MIQGIDLSHFEPALNWKAAKSSGVEWSYTKASDGREFLDWSREMHTSGARAAGVINGCYHFFRANIDAATQSSLFLGAVKGMHLDLPYILDWEEESVQGQSHSTQISRAMTILQVMENSSKRIPMIYMGLGLAKELNLPEVFAKYPLIVAKYSSILCPPPVPWKSMCAWQYTDSAHVPGVAQGHTVDSNWFLGSMEELKALATP